MLNNLISRYLPCEHGNVPESAVVLLLLLLVLASDGVAVSGLSEMSRLSAWLNSLSSLLMAASFSSGAPMRPADLSSWNLLSNLRKKYPNMMDVTYICTVMCIQTAFLCCRKAKF